MDIDIACIDDTTRVIQRVESILKLKGLTRHSRGTLKSYPGCIHWHWKNGKLPGTLEVTLWPTKRRLWFKVQAGRRAEWIDQVIPTLKVALEKG